MSAGRMICLTWSELDHLLTLLRDAEVDGSYYGPKTVYWKRHERIKEKLERRTVESTTTVGD